MYLSRRIVDREGKAIDMSAALAYLYVAQPKLYEIARALVNASDEGEVFTVLKREGFKVKYARERCAWEASHDSLPLWVTLAPKEDEQFGLRLSVIIPVEAEKVEADKQLLLGVYRVALSVSEVKEQLDRLVKRLTELEDAVRELRGRVDKVEGRLREMQEAGEDGGEGQ